MPNTAAAVGESMTCLCAGSEHQIALEKVKQVFDQIGSTLVIPENLMSSATILGACGIAFFMRYIRAASQGGIQVGFHAADAQFIAAQTARGATSLLLESGNHPEREIDKVTTPMGCTIAGLNEMEHNGLSSALIKGIVLSYNDLNKLK
jgi:pyrroline-5-carboxylate reductase